jgi:hypothetical protein
MVNFGDFVLDTLTNTTVAAADTGGTDVSVKATTLETDDFKINTGGGTGVYTFPTTLGNTGDVLKLAVSGSTGALSFTVDDDSGSGVGTGLQQFGSSDNQTEIISGPSGIPQIVIDPTGQSISIGSTTTPNHLTLNGGVEFQYNEVSTTVGPFPNPSTAPTYNMTDNDFMINVVDLLYTDIQLPQINPVGSVNRSGKMYIISRGFGGVTNLLIKPFAGDDIDGESVSINILGLGSRIQLIADGNNKWMII